ncbi:MAG: type IV secretory system conjugative DNA transfer family protein [Flavobacteriales bacterium]
MFELPLNPNTSYFARTNFRLSNKLFGIAQEDRLFHMAIFGKTGAGKTSLLETFVLQDIYYDRGGFIIDIHGDMSVSILNQIPSDKIENIRFIDISNPQLDIRFNPLRVVPYDKRSLVASNILETFKKLWKSAWGAKMEHILRYVLLSLLDQPQANFSDINRILQDKEFRQSCLPYLQNPELLTFWKKEFPSYKPFDLLPIYNKVGGFLAHPSVRRLLITNPNPMDLGLLVNQSKMILLRIPKGEIGTDTSFLLSSLFLNALVTAGFSRVSIPYQDRKPFFVYLDEFPSYTNGNIAIMLSELRKFKMGILLSCQSLSMIDRDLRDTILSNVGSVVVFRLGFSDANYFAKEFHPVFKASDFTNLSNYDIYLRLFIDGKSSRAFSGRTLLFKDIYPLSNPPV